jgi:hypothetical protein
MTAQAESVKRLSWTTWVQTQLEAGLQVWAVVDASAELPPQLRKALDHCGQVINLLAHRTSDESALALAPRLIGFDLKLSSSVLQQLWLEQAADEPVVLFVSTALGAQAFERAMRKRVRAELSDGDVMLFRWWDARVWWALQQLPQPAHPELAEFFSAFGASYSMSRDGTAMANTFAQADDDAMAALDRVILGAATFNALLELGEADAVLGICREQYPEALDAVAPEWRHALVCRQIDWAVGEGFAAPNDHALAVRIAAELGTDWHQQAAWQVLIAGAKAQGLALLAAMEALP